MWRTQYVIKKSIQILYYKYCSVAGQTYTIFLTVYNLPENATVTTMQLTGGSGSENILNLTHMSSDFDSTYFSTVTLISEVNEFTNW